MLSEYAWEKESLEEKRIIDLQMNIENKEILEESLVDEDRIKVIRLYNKQNEYLRQRLKMYKREIKGLLND